MRVLSSLSYSVNHRPKLIVIRVDSFNVHFESKSKELEKMEAKKRTSRFIPTIKRNPSRTYILEVDVRCCINTCTVVVCYFLIV